MLEKYIREVLKDIIPGKDPLSHLREGEKSLEELLRDATFMELLEKKAGRKLSEDEVRDILLRFYK